MNNQDRLMDYLYGEMDEAERRSFEEQLANDAALSAELESLRHVRTLLGSLPDARPETAVITLVPPPAPWRKWGLRAAAAVVMLLLLSWSNARIEWSSGGLVFSLGTPRPLAAPVPDTAVAELARRLERQDREMERRLSQIDSAWQNRLALSEENLGRQWETRWQNYRTRRESDMRQLVQLIRQEERPQLVSLIQNMQVEQQQELRLLLVDFWEHYQRNRETDLQSIEKEFIELYRNVEEQQSETVAILRQLR